MSKSKFYVTVLLVSVLNIPGSVYAQKTEGLSKAVQTALTRRVMGAQQGLRTFDRKLGVGGFRVDPARSTAEYSMLFGYGNYNPVLGFRMKNIPEDNLLSKPYELFHPYKGTVIMEKGEVIQVAPYTQRSQQADELLVPVEKATLPQLTEGIYLFRLANPHFALSEDGLLVKSARAAIKKEKQAAHTPDEVMELPNITLLNRLLDMHFIPKTYGQLAEETVVYPKHVTLNEFGFPVPTEQAEQARLLDNYLMLSHPRVMGKFNSSNVHLTRHQIDYTPFVLTTEEQSAAEELLAKRHQVAQVPDHATPRQLIEIAYNHLETHTMAYNSAEVSALKTHVAYPKYENTKLSHKIKEVINRADNAPWREDTDVTHLVVLDGIMGGKEFNNLQDLGRVIDAFEKLCREVPATPENIAHLQVLHQALLRTRGMWELLDTSVQNDSDMITEIWTYERRSQPFCSTRCSQDGGS